MRELEGLGWLYSSALLLFFAGCESKDWEAAGFQDGRAATINTTCKIRGMLIGGDWDNAAYARGYSQGANAGAALIAEKGCDGFR
jgi:hypothetical protein